MLASRHNTIFFRSTSKYILNSITWRSNLLLSTCPPFPIQAIRYEGSVFCSISELNVDLYAYQKDHSRNVIERLSFTGNGINPYWAICTIIFLMCQLAIISNCYCNSICRENQTKVPALIVWKMALIRRNWHDMMCM